MSAPVPVRLQCQRGHALPGGLTVRDEGGEVPRVTLSLGLHGLVEYPGGPSPHDPGERAAAQSAYRGSGRLAVTCPVCGALSTIWRETLHRRAVEAARAGGRPRVRLP